MKIIFENDDELDIIADIATKENLDAERLYDAYEDTMASNFEQDIYDLASELATEQHKFARKNNLGKDNKMTQLTVKAIRETIAHLPDDMVVYIGDDEELNGIHQAFSVQTITDDEIDTYSQGSLTEQGGLLIS